MTDRQTASKSTTILPEEDSSAARTTRTSAQSRTPFDFTLTFCEVMRCPKIGSRGSTSSARGAPEKSSSRGVRAKPDHPMQEHWRVYNES
jgi:hypothetical protein